MPKVKFNQLVESFSGRIGNVIFYAADGQNLSRTAPRVTGQRSEKQAANSARFLAAQQYAAEALQNPALKAAYKAVCVGHQNPRNLAIRDAMRAPVVERVDLSGYSGKAGQVVRIQATDDFRVVEVSVCVSNCLGEVIEEGNADLDANGWCYTARTEVAPGQSVLLTVRAKDTPGNRTEEQRWKYVPTGGS